ncbi:hypothetical protein B4098_2707 [Heyndrickxia coagulans]|uniref:Uncharacterized protein n=1 Tax=Heyndrickxia coagulans TaxID=1398 RepID=A0A150K975_HEYCO|nr:hypothetical protein B4098_2707 [Heyndrickxia coagulans]
MVTPNTAQGSLFTAGMPALNRSPHWQKPGAAIGEMKTGKAAG